MPLPDPVTFPKNTYLEAYIDPVPVPKWQTPGEKPVPEQVNINYRIWEKRKDPFGRLYWRRIQ